MTINVYRTDAEPGTRVIGWKCEDVDSGGSRIAANHRLATLVLYFCFCLSNALGAQRPGPRDPENPNVNSDERFEKPGSPGRFSDDQTKQQRYTRHLAYRCLPNKFCRNSVEESAVEPASNVLQRIGISSESPDQSRTDMVADGTVTVYTASGPIAFGVTLIQNGEHGSQRILLQQPDGKLWDGRADHLVPGAGSALEFLETQYRRGLSAVVEISRT